MWSPTKPELRISFLDSLHTPDPAQVYLPTEPPAQTDDADAQATGRVTPLLGLSERPEPPISKDRVVLVRLEGATAGQLHTLPAAGIVIGRDLRSDLRIADVGLSRTHAKLYHENGSWWLKDLGSRNGTYVGGRAITLEELHDGCLLRFGPIVTFRFQLMDAQEEATQRRLYETSHRDPITGAYNRRYLEDRLGAELAFSLRHGTKISIVLLDLDHFKGINDTYGHIAGDAVLRHVAEAVRSQLRAEDVFARFGGEEFAVLLRDIGTIGTARVAERVRACVADSPLLLKDKVISVTTSAGCACLEECAQPIAEELLSIADRRLYSAKSSGRNRVVAAG